MPRKSKLEPFRNVIGIKTDAEVAELAGVSRVAVANYRRRHNIAASRGRGQPPFEEAHPEIVPRLGQEPDTAIASDYGITRQFVQSIRTRLNIAAFQEFSV